MARSETRSTINPLGNRTSWRVWQAVVILLPVASALVFAFVYPRAYSIYAIDIEADYYYNGRLAALGYGIEGTYHPGTPIYMLSGLLLRIVGVDIEHTQLFFTLGYVLVGLFTSACAYGAFHLLASTTRPGAAIWSVAAVLAWPPAIGYLNYWGADSFLPGLVLIVVGLFWRALHLATSMRVAQLGAILGLLTAVKLTALPLVMGVSVGLWVDASVRHSARVAIQNGALLAGVGAASFALLTLPVLDHMPGVLYRWGLWMVPYVEKVVAAPFLVLGATGAPAWAVPVVGAAALMVLFLALNVLIRKRRALTTGATDRTRLVPEPAAVLSFLMCTGGFWLLIVVRGIVDGDGWVGFRLATPSAAALSVAVLAIGTSRLRQLRLSGLAAAGSVVLILLSVVLHGRERHDAIQKAERHEALYLEVLDGQRGEARTAFWIPGFEGRYGKAAFHFRGNYHYGIETFDADLLKYFPDVTFLRLQQIVGRSDLPEATVADGTVEAVDEWLRSSQGSDYFWPLDRPYVGYEEGAKVASLVTPLPVWTDKSTAPPQKIDHFLEPLFGPLSSDTLHIGQEKWIVWDILSSDSLR